MTEDDDLSRMGKVFLLLFCLLYLITMEPSISRLKE